MALSGMLRFVAAAPNPPTTAPNTPAQPAIVGIDISPPLFAMFQRQKKTKTASGASISHGGERTFED